MRKGITLHVAAILWCCSMLPLLWLTQLPELQRCWLAIAGALLSMMCLPRRWVIAPAILVIGASWGLMHAINAVDVVATYHNTRYTVSGDVLSLAFPENATERVLLQVTEVEGARLCYRCRFTLNLTDNQKRLAVQAGDRLVVNVKIRAVHANLNEGGFNRQRWGFAHQRMLNGRLLSIEQIERHASLRQKIVDALWPFLADKREKGLMIALLFGERVLVGNETTQLFKQTGVAHLMAISGLHISLSYLILRVLLMPLYWLLPLKWLQPVVITPVLLVLTGGYVWLSGMNAPALRAFYALLLWHGLRHIGWHWSRWQLFWVVVALLLCFDPLMVLSDSAWLSVSAVAALLFWSQWRGKSQGAMQRKLAWLQKGHDFLHLQAGLTLLLISVQGLFFQGMSVFTIVANLLAIPLVTFVVLPLLFLLLLTLFIPVMASVISVVAHAALLGLLAMLNTMTSGWLVFSLPMALLAALMPVVVLLWQLRCYRHLGGLALTLLLMSWRYGLYQERQRAFWRLDMLDVGHGLAIVISRGEQAVLYDTGGRWLQGSAAEQMVLPFIRRRGLTLEGIILSHDDLDHAGGLDVMRQAFPTSWLRRSGKGALPCVAGESWRALSLQFQVLWPQQQTERAANEDSCVVLVSDGQYRVLLTGDLGRKEELALVEKTRHQLPATLLQVPHHGSSRSSSAVFLRAVNAELAINSISRYNPWQLPSKLTLQRYHDLALPWLSTSDTGQISVIFKQSHWQVYQYRQDRADQWYNRPFGDESNR